MSSSTENSRNVRQAPASLLSRFDWIAALGVLFVVLVVTWTEPDPRMRAEAAAVTAALLATLFVLTRRRRFSLFIVAMVLALIFAVSTFKFQLVAMNVHVYDLFFYAFNTAQIAFFYATYPMSAGLATVALALFVGAVWWLRRSETPVPMRLRTQAALLGAAALGGGLALQSLTSRNADYFSENRSVLSAAFASLGDMPALIAGKGIFEVSARAGLGPIPVEAISCTPQGRPPDIVMFLNESVMPPGVHGNFKFPAETANFFKSHDGSVHNLRVETFGGGTWLSDFSALTGVSTNTFGNMRNFAAQMMTGRLRHSLPQYLKACGYETTVIYPSSADFAGSARFYLAIGFDKVIDKKVHRAPDERQRDAFYYAQVAKVLDDAKARGSDKPQFVLASSMATHSPWDFRFAPEMVKPGEKMRWNGDAELDEYLWRIVVAKRDRDAFRAGLAKNWPGRPFLFVNYGDHQPALARVPLEQDPVNLSANGSAWQLDPKSPAFTTYYSVDALNFTPRSALPDVPILEIPHLPVVTVMAAGLPLDAVFQRRKQLIETCNGAYFTCGDQAAVATFQRWLADAGWLAQN